MKYLVVVLLALTIIAPSPVDYTDYWCNTVDSVLYTCIECAAFPSIEECNEYKRTHMPNAETEAVWDYIFGEPPEEEYICPIQKIERKLALPKFRTSSTSSAATLWQSLESVLLRMETLGYLPR